jgi:hypothetical protein
MQFSLQFPVPAVGAFPFCAAKARPARRHNAASETNNFMYLILLTSTRVFRLILFFIEIGPIEQPSQRLPSLNDI